MDITSELSDIDKLVFTNKELKLLSNQNRYTLGTFYKSSIYKERMCCFRIIDDLTHLRYSEILEYIVSDTSFLTLSLEQILKDLKEMSQYVDYQCLDSTIDFYSKKYNFKIKDTFRVDSKTIQQETSNMFNQLFNNQFKNAFTKNLFSEVSNLAWDLMSNSVAIIKDSELCSFDSEQNCVTVNVASSFSMPLPGFAQAMPIDTVKVGDIFVKDGLALGWIIELVKDKEDKNIVKLKYMQIDGTEKTFTPPKIVNPLTGTTNTVMISRDLTGMLGGDNNKDSFKSSLLPLMMMNGGNLDMSKMMPMMLMSAQSGSDSNMMQMLMMQQMMSNNKNLPL